MTDIKVQEDKYVSDMKKNGVKMTDALELAMRIAFSAGASLFRVIGRYEGDKARRNKIIDALGIVEEEVIE